MVSFRGSRFLVVSPVGLSLFPLVAVVVVHVVFGARALPCSVTVLSPADRVSGSV